MKLEFNLFVDHRGEQKINLLFLLGLTALAFLLFTIALSIGIGLIGLIVGLGVSILVLTFLWLVKDYG